MAPTKYINLLTDFGFKRVFGNEEIMAAFLNDLIQPKSKICHVLFVDKEMEPTNKYERGVIYDLRCTLEDNSEIIVEMQKGEQEYFADRILYYLARSVAMQGYKGKRPKPDNIEVDVEWNFELKPVYGIFFLNFSIANMKPSPLREIGFYTKGAKEEFCSKVKAYTIELPEYKNNKESDCKDKLDYWTYIINNMENLTSVPFVPQMPVFGKLGELAETAAMTPAEYQAYQDSVDAYRTTKASFDFYEKRGREEGRKEGRAEGQLMVAKTLKDMGWSDEQIATTCHVSLDDVKNLSSH